MAYGTDGLSASDVALITNSDGRNNNSGWGDGGAWWIIIFLIFAFLGWGRNGFGGGFGGGFDGSTFNYSPCCTPATQQGLSDAFNFNQLDNGIRGVQNGLCDGFYSINSSIANLGSALLQCCCETKSAIATNGYETRDAINTNANSINSNLCNGFNGINQAINNLGFNLQDCCCQTQRSIDGVNYNMAKNTSDIIQANNANTQRIIDTLTQNEITSLRTELQSAQLQLSNFSQTQNIVNQLRPCPVPAYITCSPYTSYNFNPYNYNNCGCGCGCGC